jgi:hypothetical protein
MSLVPFLWFDKQGHSTTPQQLYTLAETVKTQAKRKGFEGGGLWVI